MPSTKLIAAVTALVISLGALPVFAEPAEWQKWIGPETKDVPALLTQFEKACVRKFQHSIEKIKTPYEIALNWNKAHCACTARFLKAKNDPVFLRTVNADLTGKLDKLPELPGELSSYFEGFDDVRERCEADPTYISETEKKATKPSKLKNRKDTVPKGLPFRPQKGTEGAGLDGE